MIIEPPKTIEEFEAIRKTILELLSNRYSSESMLRTLNIRLNKTDAKISELKAQIK